MTFEEISQLKVGDVIRRYCGSLFVIAKVEEVMERHVVQYVEGPMDRHAGSVRWENFNFYSYVPGYRNRQKVKKELGLE